LRYSTGFTRISISFFRSAKTYGSNDFVSIAKKMKICHFLCLIMDEHLRLKNRSIIAPVRQMI